MLNIFKLLFKRGVVGQQGDLHHLHLQNKFLDLRKLFQLVYILIPIVFLIFLLFFKNLLLLLNFFNFPFILQKFWQKPLLFSSLFFLYVPSCTYICINWRAIYPSSIFLGLRENPVSKIVPILFVFFFSFLSFSFNKDFRLIIFFFPILKEGQINC